MLNAVIPLFALCRGHSDLRSFYLIKRLSGVQILIADIMRCFNRTSS
jgi:hypothetical protein